MVGVKSLTAGKGRDRMKLSNAKRIRRAVMVMCVAVGLATGPASAQIESIDPDAAIDGDLAGESTTVSESAPASATWSDPKPQATSQAPAPVDDWVEEDIAAPAAAVSQSSELPPVANTPDAASPPPVASAAPVAGAAPAADESTTYRKDDLMGAAEGVFGKGSQGLASIIEDLLKKQGEPNGYIVGREGSGAIAFGLRYGSGTLYHKVEGQRPVYWTGPSLGLDLGLNAGKAFVLVYNLYDTQELFHRYGAGEGQAYLVGGFHISYLRRGDVVLIPVRMGAGLRLGANVGYMKFSEKQRWLPF